MSADRVRQFLSDLEEKRGCAIATRNQRLAAIHALARFIGLHAPELVEWCGQVRTVPFKKAPQALVTYLEKPEMDALLATPDTDDRSGPSGSCLASVPVQRRRSGRRSGPGPDRRPDVAPGARPRPGLGPDPGQGEQVPPVPTVGTDGPRAGCAGARPCSKRARVPESVRPTHHAVRHPHAGRALRGPGGDSRCRRWPPSGSARTRFATRRRPTSCVREWTSTRSVPGSGTCR